MKRSKIHFEDNGQDFLTWEINEQGVVVRSEPFQTEVWKDSIVLNIDELEPGNKVVIIPKDDDEPLEIKHKIEKIEEL